MKKQILAFLAVGLVLFSFFSCSEEKKNDKLRYDFDLSSYIEVAEYENIRASFADPDVCTDEEVENALFQVRLSYADFTEKSGPAEMYDRVKLSYQVFYNEKELEAYSEEESFIVIGSDGFGDMEYTLGLSLVGASAGEEKTVEYTFPKEETSLGSWAGLTVTMKGKIEQVWAHQIPEFTDEFVEDQTALEMSTVQELKDALREEILLQKENRKAQAVFQAYMSQVTVKQYPEDEVSYYVERIKQDVLSAAQEVDLSYGQYLEQYLAQDEEAFEAQLLKDAQTQVKNDMACIQLSRLMGTELSEEEYQTGLEELYISEGGEETGFATLSEFEEYYTEKEIRESLLWQKSFRQLVENAVRVDP